MTTTLGNSNVRGGLSRQTRINPIRVTRGFGSSQQRHSTLTSHGGLSMGQSHSSNTAAAANSGLQSSDPARLYPAITHFADAIAALPREFRRHNSLLKEVDAKAWQAEESLQNLLQQCLADPVISAPNLVPAALQTGPGSATADDGANASEVNSVAGASVENASLASVRSADPVILQRRRQFHALRQQLMTIMVTMDEKNHVINNANEEVAKHIRRLDRIWSHIPNELSEETRLGSLRHWGYPDLNPVKKPAVPVPRKEGATSTASIHEREIAHRSEARREALLARRQRHNQVDSDFDEARPAARRTNHTPNPTPNPNLNLNTNPNGKKRAVDAAPDSAGLGILGASAAKRKRPDKLGVGGIGMERSTSSTMGSRPMSRENSQQDNAKKRKASAAPTTVARKRINASAQDSPKLASSPLSGTTGKEAYKRSPALSTVRPAGRGRQNSTQAVESARARPSSSASNKNGSSSNFTASTPEVNNVAGLAGKSMTESKPAMKENKTDKGERLLEDKVTTGTGSDGEAPLRSATLVERTVSRQEGATQGELSDDGPTRAIASPRLPLAVQTIELKSERPGRGRASKTSTPVAGTFAEAEEAETGSTNGNGHHGKSKRPSRPRVKDHGLHDSLSPKGLPMKRQHKKSLSLSTLPPPLATTQRLKEENDAPNSTTSSERGGLDNDVGDDDEEVDGGEDDEERYCYCQGVSYGEMVACDKPDCPRQWFHLDCIGLKSVPKSAKWYCDECKEALAKKGRVAGGGNGNGNGSGNINGSGSGGGSGSGSGSGSGNDNDNGNGNESGSGSGSGSASGNGNGRIGIGDGTGNGNGNGK